MGILRADRITGLGGANAIKGSTKLSENRLLEIHGAESNEDFRLSNGSFTIEFWAYVADTSNSTFVALFENNPARRSWQFEARSDQALRFEWWTDGSSGTSLTSSTGAFIRDRWQHFAVVRNGTALNIYVDGTSVANTTTSDTLYENTIEPLTIGGIFQSGALTQGVTGFISNLRIIKGEAIYTANFTPPTSELTVTSNTVVLACQSPGNVFQEATGKTVVATTTSTNDAPPQASHFTPNSPVGLSTTTDVGGQYGTTFDGFGNFATSTYMVPPGGNTRERNRGRAVFMGGNIHPVSPSFTANIDYVEMTTSGVGVRFGSLTSVNQQNASFASSTRGISAGGQTGSPDTQTNVIEFVTISTEGNATDFGNLDTAHRRLGGQGHSNQTRGIVAGGGGDSPAQTNVIQFVTIATLGDATNFGDLLNPKDNSMSKNGSSTRMLICGGRDYTPSATNINVIEYITIATTGDSQNFGDLSAARNGGTGCSNATRGIIAGGQTPTVLNTIDFVTIATLGDATDFGDLTATLSFLGGASNSTKGIFAGGQTPTKVSTIQSINIASTGNAVAFGDNTVTNPVTSRGTCSDSHGGIS